MDRLLAALCAVIRVGLHAPFESSGLDLTALLTPPQDEVCEAYPEEEPAGPGGPIRPFEEIAREFNTTYGADMSRLYDGGTVHGAHRAVAAGAAARGGAAAERVGTRQHRNHGELA